VETFEAPLLKTKGIPALDRPNCEGWARADKSDKVDRAAAYYHYALACMYAEMDASSGGRNPEYANKAIENHKAAIKADPQTPGRLLGSPRFVIPAVRLPAPRHEAGRDSK